MHLPLVVWTQAPKLLQITSSPQTYPQNAPVTITAKLTGPGGVLPGAQVTLTVFDASNQLAMRDDGLFGDAVAGDGVWSRVITAPIFANYWPTPTHPYFGYLVTAVHGTDVLTKTSMFIVSPQSGRLVSIAGGTGYDDNGNGWFDGLQFTATVVITHPGRFEIGALLKTELGQFRGWNITETVLQPGTHALVMRFPNNFVQRPLGTSAYTISEVYMEDTSAMSVLLDVLQTVFTTPAYSDSQFE